MLHLKNNRFISYALPIAAFIVLIIIVAFYKNKDIKANSFPSIIKYNNISKIDYNNYGCVLDNQHTNLFSESGELVASNSIDSNGSAIGFDIVNLSNENIPTGLMFSKAIGLSWSRHSDHFYFTTINESKKDKSLLLWTDSQEIGRPEYPYIEALSSEFANLMNKNLIVNSMSGWVLLLNKAQSVLIAFDLDTGRKVIIDNIPNDEKIINGFVKCSDLEIDKCDIYSLSSKKYDEPQDIQSITINKIDKNGNKTEFKIGNGYDIKLYSFKNNENIYFLQRGSGNRNAYSFSPSSNKTELIGDRNFVDFVNLTYSDNLGLIATDFFGQSYKLENDKWRKIIFKSYGLNSVKHLGFSKKNGDLFLTSNQDLSGVVISSRNSDLKKMPVLCSNSKSISKTLVQSNSVHGNVFGEYYPAKKNEKKNIVNYWLSFMVALTVDYIPTRQITYSNSPFKTVLIF